MSNDPFQDLFDRGVPRNASPASTRATLDSLTPQFRRAKSRRRSRVGALAAVAILGTTGGAAALGVGPVALNHRPRTDFTGLANSSAVQNLPELQDLAADPATKAIDDLSNPGIIVEPEALPDTNNATASDEIEVGADDSSTKSDIAGDSSSSEGSSDSSSSDETSDSGKSDDPSGSDDSSGPDDPSKSEDSSTTDNSGDSNKADDSTKADAASGSDESGDSADTESSSGRGDGASDPVAGPLTETLTEGSVTVDVNSKGDLELVGSIVTGDGVRYEADLSDHEEIKVKFFSNETRELISEVKFHLVDGGITVKVEVP